MARRLTIGALATQSGLSRDTIQFYEREAVLPQPTRTPAGYRLYGPEVVEQLAFIKHACDGFSLADIRAFLGGIRTRKAAGRCSNSSSRSSWNSTRRSATYRPGTRC